MFDLKSQIPQHPLDLKSYAEYEISNRGYAFDNSWSSEPPKKEIFRANFNRKSVSKRNGIECYWSELNLVEVI